ncbi:MAG: hypothetical protein WAK93_08610 [Solirubrobacteraceae bacterium]
MIDPGDLLAIVLVAAAVASSVWVLRDARARGIPRRKAFTWAALQFVEWPVFLWLYHRIRPRRRLEQR